MIAVEWYISSHPLGVRMADGHYPECNISENRFFLLHIYPATLLGLAFFYGISVLKIKRNFNEGRWITCATLFVIPIFIAWSITHHFAPIQFHDPSTAVSIVAVAGVLLSAIFLPKMHTIAQQTKYKNALQSGISSIDLQRSHSDSTVFTGFSEFSPHDAVQGKRQHIQTNASTMHKLYQHHQPPHMIPSESSTNGNFFNPTNGTGGFIFPSSPYASYNTNSTIPIHPFAQGLPMQGEHNKSGYHWTSNSDRSNTKRSDKRRDHMRKHQVPSGPEFNGLNYINNTSMHAGNPRLIHKHNPKSGAFNTPRIQSYVDWSKELFPDYNFDADNTGGSSSGTLPGSHHYYNQTAAFYNKYNLDSSSAARNQPPQNYPQHRIYTPAHYAPISNFPNIPRYGDGGSKPDRKERKSRKDDSKKRKATSAKKRFKSSSPMQHLLIGSKNSNEFPFSSKSHKGMIDRYGIIGSSAPKARRWRSHSGSSREEINESMLNTSLSSKLLKPNKTYQHPIFSATVPISNLLDKTNENSSTNNSNASKKQKDNYKSYATGMIMHNIRKRSDDHQDLVTTMIGGGVYNNFSNRHMDSGNGKNNSMMGTSNQMGASRERYNKILSTAMPATDNPRNSKDDFGKKGLGNSTKSTTNPYLESRSSRSREAQRHSRSPSDGMILTASGLTLDPSNPEFEKEVITLCN